MTTRQDKIISRRRLFSIIFSCMSRLVLLRQTTHKIHRVGVILIGSFIAKIGNTTDSSHFSIAINNRNDWRIYGWLRRCSRAHTQTNTHMTHVDKIAILSTAIQVDFVPSSLDLHPQNDATEYNENNHPFMPQSQPITLTALHWPNPSRME